MKTHGSSGKWVHVHLTRGSFTAGHISPATSRTAQQVPGVDAGQEAPVVPTFHPHLNVLQAQGPRLGPPEAAPHPEYQGGFCDHAYLAGGSFRDLETRLGEALSGSNERAFWER